MTTHTADYVQGADAPTLNMVCKIDGTATDLSSGYTFELKVSTTSTNQFTKTTGITGTTTGCQIVWSTSGELNTINAGTYIAQLTATQGSTSRQYIWQFRLRMRPAAV